SRFSNVELSRSTATSPAEHHNSVTETNLSLDPRVSAGLASLRRRVKRLAWLHGFGTWLLFAAFLWVSSFYLDRFLNPPHAMRLVVAPLVWCSAAAGLLWWVIRRARVKVTEEDAALLVER